MSDSLRPHGLHGPHASLPITNSQSLLKLMSIKSVMPSNRLIVCHPLLLPPSIFPTIRVFSSESVLHIRWPKYWSFSFNISSSKEYSGLISFMTDWLDLLAVQGTLKSLLQYHSSKALILQHSAFFIVQLSHPYMTTGKTVAFPLTPQLKVTYPSVLFKKCVFNGILISLVFWAPKALQMVTRAMKLRLLLLERKAMRNIDSILKSRDITFLKGPSGQSYGFSNSHVWM